MCVCVCTWSTDTFPAGGGMGRAVVLRRAVSAGRQTGHRGVGVVGRTLRARPAAGQLGGFQILPGVYSRQALRGATAECRGCQSLGGYVCGVRLAERGLRSPRSKARGLGSRRRNSRHFWPVEASVARRRGPEGNRMAALDSDSDEDLVSYGTGLEPLEEGASQIGLLSLWKTDREPRIRGEKV